MLNYKGYTGSVDIDLDDGVLHGRVVGIRDVVNFEATSLPELDEEFRASVDDYLGYCEELGREPDKPFSGEFRVRIPPELHRDLAIRSKRAGISMNQYVIEKLAH